MDTTLSDTSDYDQTVRAVRLLLCRSSGCISMVGRAEASQDAPVSSKAGKTNSVRFHHP
ncbi:ash family protein [Salmonella sp. 741265116_PST]|uniref:ash family protein n=1 Tax=Salmonella sp. 741265116_PST TaxID=3389067 RepID=UPI003980BAD7